MTRAGLRRPGLGLGAFQDGRGRDPAKVHDRHPSGLDHELRSLVGAIDEPVFDGSNRYVFPRRQDVLVVMAFRATQEEPSFRIRRCHIRGRASAPDPRPLRRDGDGGGSRRRDVPLPPRERSRAEAGSWARRPARRWTIARRGVERNNRRATKSAGRRERSRGPATTRLPTSQMPRRTPCRGRVGGVERGSTLEAGRSGRAGNRLDTSGEPVTLWPCVSRARAIGGLPARRPGRVEGRSPLDAECSGPPRTPKGFAAVFVCTDPVASGPVQLSTDVPRPRVTT